MSSASAVSSAALHLARQERADLARQLIASLDEEVDATDEGVEAAWLAEVEQRLVAAEQGSASFGPWEAAEERIAARLRDMRR
jgi:putative addiction module component (TIGR02574 family)